MKSPLDSQSITCPTYNQEDSKPFLNPGKATGGSLSHCAVNVLCEICSI